MAHQGTFTDVMWIFTIAVFAGSIAVWALTRSADRRAWQAAIAQLCRAIQLNAEATSSAAKGSGGVAEALGALGKTLWDVVSTTRDANSLRRTGVELVKAVRAGEIPHPNPSRPKASSPSSIPPAPRAPELSSPSQPGEDNEITAAFDRTFFKSTTTLMSEGTASARPTLRGGKAVGT